MKLYYVVTTDSDKLADEMALKLISRYEHKEINDLSNCCLFDVATEIVMELHKNKGSKLGIFNINVHFFALDGDNFTFIEKQSLTIKNIYHITRKKD